MPSERVEDTSQSSPFVRQLASSGKISKKHAKYTIDSLNRTLERKTRERALSSLRTYLHRSTPFTSLELLKLWKGLFYCMFMTDKPRNQQQLARDLADLVDILTTRENVLGFLKGFWQIMGKEWGGIDSLRMDKYLYLVRCYVNKGFEVCSRKSWADEALLDGYLSILRAEGGPLSSRDARVPNGLRLHVLDIWFDELDKVDSGRSAPVEKIASPIRKLGKETIVKSVRERVKDTLLDGRLEDWADKRKPAEDVGSDGENSDEDFAGFKD